jgi:probable HAF family extracellular repeat protein
VLVATLGTYAIASAATYTVTDLGTLGGTQSFPTAINARGDIVGYSSLAGDSAVHAFLYESRHGRMIDLDPRGTAASSLALDINDHGRIAGQISVAGNNVNASHAALFVRGRVIDLGTPPGFASASAGAINHAGDTLIGARVTINSVQVNGFLLHHGHTIALPIIPLGLNDRRQVAGALGQLLFPSSLRAVVLDRNGMFEPLPGLDSQLSSAANAINARGDVVGTYTAVDGSTRGAFLERDSVFTDLGTLPGAIPVAVALNSHDQVVGTALAFSTVFGQHAILYDARLDPPMQDLNDLIPPDSGIELDAATAINDRGSIVCVGTVNGQSLPNRAFLLTPNPSSP